MSARHLAVMIAFAVAAAACGGDSVASSTTTSTEPAPSGNEAWQQVVDHLRDLQRSQSLPDHLQRGDATRDGTEFDVGAYFEIFEHIEPEPGFALDYVYALTADRGFPHLYVRRADEPGYSTVDEFSYLTGGLPVQGDTSYLDQIYVIDGTPLGFFEYAVLHVMGGQFYLFWHAIDNDSLVVASRGALEEALRPVEGVMDPAELEKARAVDPSPRVTFDGDHAIVEIGVFSRSSGLSRRTYTIERIFPQVITDVAIEPLAECLCGIPL